MGTRTAPSPKFNLESSKELAATTVAELREVQRVVAEEARRLDQEGEATIRRLEREAAQAQEEAREARRDSDTVRFSLGMELESAEAKIGALLARAEEERTQREQQRVDAREEKREREDRERRDRAAHEEALRSARSEVREAESSRDEARAALESERRRHEKEIQVLETRATEAASALERETHARLEADEEYQASMAAREEELISLRECVRRLERELQEG